MTTTEDLNHVQQLSKVKAEHLKVKETNAYSIGSELEFMTDDVDSKPPELRTKAEWAEIISEGTKSKVSFTVTMRSDIDLKFKEIMLHFQNKYPLGKVYKHYVISKIIEEAHERMKRAGMI